MKHEKISVLKVTRLDCTDEELSRIKVPNGELVITRGIGSGLTRSASYPANHFWAIGDRGPNFKIPFAIEVLGLRNLGNLENEAAIKVMPMPHIGPAISELKIESDKITCIQTLELIDKNNVAISGLPSLENTSEIAVGLDGKQLAAHFPGADSEGIAAMNDGTFWIADEYCPSIIRVSANGAILARWIPKGLGHLFAKAAYPVREVLPNIATTRQFNRGFEALAISPDENWLYVAFQSPLAHPDEKAHLKARHVRIWKLNTQTGEIAAQYLYPLDKPQSFARDKAKGKFHKSDIKLSELTTICEGKLLVLERGSQTSKFYVIEVSQQAEIDEKHLDIQYRPTLEQLSDKGFDSEKIPILAKTFIFSSDDYPQIGADLEGVLLLSPRTILLVNDNDFGVEGVATNFWRVELSGDL